MAHRTLRVAIVVLVLLFAVNGAVAANTLIQVTRPDGVGLTLTHRDAVEFNPIQGSDMFWMVTSEYTGRAAPIGSSSTIVVVEDERVVQVYTGSTVDLPAISPPAHGYVLIGSGVYHSFLRVLQIGDSITLLEKERSLSEPRPNAILIDGEVGYLVSGINKGRGAEQLIVYTPDFGTHTLTNQWGTDYTVVDNQVVAIRAYDTVAQVPIPENGFVVSAIGGPRSWLQQRAGLGSRIELDFLLSMDSGPTPPAVEGVTWFNARTFGVSGKAWSATEGDYDRLPAHAKSVVRPEVWALSQNSSGMYVEFETDATSIHAWWHLNRSQLAMSHMAATGVSGLDLYILDDTGQWRWLAVGRPDNYPDVHKELVSGLPGERRRYRLYLPLYNGVQAVYVGVNAGATLHPVSPSDQKPVVFYGTSITQGAVASRPGMAYPAILGRRLDVPTVNLGFSGQGRMDLEIAHLMAEIDAAVYVLDAVPNMNAAMIRQNFEPFVRILRAARPDVPIVVIEGRVHAHSAFVPSVQQGHDYTRTALREVYERLVAAGVSNLYFVSRDELRSGPLSLDTYNLIGAIFS